MGLARAWRWRVAASGAVSRRQRSSHASAAGSKVSKIIKEVLDPQFADRKDRASLHRATGHVKLRSSL
eukprot:scaffold8_cov249-Pinguiococcus_pyrenoidosus.AAC.4